MNTYWSGKDMLSIFYTGEPHIINNVNPDKTNLNHDMFNYQIKYMDKININKVKDFLDENSNYITSLETLEFIIFNPFSDKKLNIIAYNNNDIIASIVGIKRSLKIKSSVYECIHTTYLCVNKQYRHQNIHFYMIDLLMTAALSLNIKIGIFSTTKPLKNIKYLKVDRTYIVQSKKNKYTNLLFDYTKLNNRSDDVHFIYSSAEINYWFNNKFCILVNSNGNFLCFLKLKYKNGKDIHLLIEEYKHNNNINKLMIPNNSIINDIYPSLNQLQLPTKIYSYIYNVAFDKLSSSLRLF